MKITLQYEGDNKWLRIPYEYDAPERLLRICDENGREASFPVKLSVSRIDLWMSYPLDQFKEGFLTVEAEGKNWLKAVCTGAEPEEQKRREASRPQIHYMPPTGGISEIHSIRQEDSGWVLKYTAAPCSLSNGEGCVRETIASRDLLHWSLSDRKSSETGLKCAEYWVGDVEEQYVIEEGSRRRTIAKTTGQRIENLAAACVLSLPAQIREKKIKPASETANLRVWERLWHNKKISGDFRFLMRFKLGPDIWPEIRVLEKENTVHDIQTKACEVELELFAGQEPEIEFDLCGVRWIWKALDQSISFGKYKMKAPAEEGRLHLHFFSDMVIQELFADTDKAALFLKKEGPEKENYRIQSDQVENINNSSFQFEYNSDPYIAIHTPGTTASIISMHVWGLRSTAYAPENRKLLKAAERGKVLYSCENYKVYENCVEDRIYGEPAAWALNEGKTVLSPVRAVEEFCWRDTPWGDMTRIINRTERWDAPQNNVYPRAPRNSCPAGGSAAEPQNNVYPVLRTKYAVLNAAFAMATDIMQSNRNESYALPGQQGLMNAALFQGEGEGFGSWVRDTCHAAFRCQNLLAPGEARESLVYISEHGFNNGEDCAAMPAIAAWDYYIATGDIQLLFEMLPGILRYAKEADDRYDEEINLVHASMCLAQDAFEEPENGGYCLGTEIAFAWMYQSAAKICEVTGCEMEAGRHWAERSERMMQSIRQNYWNEEKACFTSGPVGSQAYENGWWETTGAEMSIWPRFGIASKEQRMKFLQTIKQTPDACSDFGINWYPFRKEKNHFWRACWVSWTLGISAAAGDVGDTEFIRDLIFQQVRNVLLNKSFHEVMDYDTGRAWRWPHLPWHAAGFIGFIMNGVLGIRYDENGLTMKPAVPEEFDGAQLTEWNYRKGQYTIWIHGYGTNCQIRLDDMPLEQPFGLDMEGRHRIDIYASKTHVF